MSTAFRIDYVEQALLALLRANLPAAYAAQLGLASINVDINGLGDDDFDEEGQLVLQPPSLRVRFMGSPYNPARDNQRLTYQAHIQFEILCFESSLTSKADERRQTLILVGTVQDQLAGTRLKLTDGTVSMPITMQDAVLIEGGGAGVDQLFAVHIEIEGFAQFSAANANPS